MLKVWLPLTGDLHNQGISGVTATGHSVTSVAAGKIGSCYQFTTSAIELDDNIFDNSVTEFTVAAWMKFNNSNSACLFSDRTATNWNGITCFIMDSGNIFFDVGTRWEFTPSTAIPRNQWFHIAFLYKKNVLRQVYLNGALIGSTTSAPAPTTTSTGHSFIGASQTSSTTLGGNYFNGWMNDVRIYDECLSAATIHEIAQGLVLHYKLNGGLFGNPNLLLNTHFDNRYNQTTGWDTTKNGTLLASNWGGYNPGVANASTSYHAHLTLFQDEYVYEYTKENETWLGISQDDELRTKLVAGKTYTFSCEQYSVTNTNYMYGGLYYFKTGATSAGFHLGYISCNTNRILNVWQKFTYTFTAPSDGDYSKSMRWYCYGQSGGAGTFYLRHLKLEEGSVATPWCPADSELDIDRTIVEDSSGYNHNGTIVGSAIPAADTARYDISAHIDGAGVITTTSPGADIRTLSCWVKTTKNKSTSQMLVADSASNMCISFYNGTIIGVFGATRSTGSKCTLGTSYKENDWNHIVVVKTSDDGKRDIYCNGEKLTPATDDYWSATAGFFVGNRNGSGSGNTPFFGYISDVRAYCTQLLDTDIKQLYNISMKIDKNQNIHNFETVEDGQNKITKKGQLKCANIIEYINGQAYRGPQNDPNIYIEPDGSCWIRIFHHNNPASYLFKNTDNFLANIYKDENRWFNFNICNFVHGYEFIARVKRTANDTERVYRWIQSANPLIATFDQTKVANITKISGYDTWPLGGLYKLNSSTYLTANNGTNGNWFGATGCWTAWNGGIPGWASTSANDAITTGYIDIYLRIDSDTTVISNRPNAVQSKKNNLWLALEAIER